MNYTNLLKLMGAIAINYEVASKADKNLLDNHNGMFYVIQDAINNLACDVDIFDIDEQSQESVLSLIWEDALDRARENAIKRAKDIEKGWD